MSYPYLSKSMEEFNKMLLTHYIPRQVREKGINPQKIDSKKDFFKKYIIPIRVWVESLGPRVLFPKIDIDNFLGNKVAVAAAIEKGIMMGDAEPKKQQKENMNDKGILANEAASAVAALINNDLKNEIKEIFESVSGRIENSEIKNMEGRINFYQKVVSELYDAIRDFETKLEDQSMAVRRADRCISQINEKLNSFISTVCTAAELTKIEKNTTKEGK